MRNDKMSEVAKDIVEAAGILHNMTCVISNRGDIEVIKIAKNKLNKFVNY